MKLTRMLCMMAVAVAVLSAPVAASATETLKHSCIITTSNVTPAPVDVVPVRDSVESITTVPRANASTASLDLTAAPLGYRSPRFVEPG